MKLFQSRIDELKAEKEHLEKNLTIMKEDFKNEVLTKEQYVEAKFNLLQGKFEEDILADINRNIEKVLRRRKAANAMMFYIGLGLAITLILNIGDLTGFATLEESGLGYTEISQNFTDNSTLNYAHIITDTLRASGSVYGYGEAWIYLVTNNSRRLVYYSDTGQQQSITGMLTATPLNETNSTSTTLNETSNQSSTNETSSNQTNTTNNSSIQTLNSTDQTNSTINQTGNQTNESAEPIVPEIEIGDTAYNIGDNISFSIAPEDADYTLYLHAPDDTYILSDTWWIAQGYGDHTITALVSVGNSTKRISATVHVISPLEIRTAEFAETCLETCSMQEMPVVLEIVLRNTKIELDNISHANQDNETNESVQGETIQEQVKEPKTTPLGCEHPNPNKRGASCLYEDAEEYFPNQEIMVQNLDRDSVGRVTPIGNLLIGGGIVENSNSSPGRRDFRIGYVDRDGNSVDTIWIDSDGNLHLKGYLYEENENLNPPQGAYSMVNNREIILVYADQKNGDLHLRGNVIPYRYGGRP